jgi:hypothetical protein
MRKSELAKLEAAAVLVPSLTQIRQFIASAWELMNVHIRE